jgi:hypothetical protein
MELRMFVGGPRLSNRQQRSPPSILPSSMAGWREQPKSPSPWRLSRQLVANRRRQYWIVFIVILVVVLLLINPATVLTRKPPPEPTNTTKWEYPPTLAKLKQWERDLPQHSLDLPFPEGKTGRYVKFSNQVKRLGWNNAFNEMYVLRVYYLLLD